MADYLNLFQSKRLSTNESHHLEYIKGRLAALKVEDPSAYKDFSDFYGVTLDVAVTKEPIKPAPKPVKVPVKKVK